MPETRKPLGRTIIDGLAGLVYEDPITLWGSALAVVLTWGLVETGLLSGVWIGVVLLFLVWLAIAISLIRAARTHARNG